MARLKPNVEIVDDVERALTPGGTLACSVPVPERNRRQIMVRDTLHSEAEWETIRAEHDLDFELLQARNGALLYCKGVKR
jgi:hypothetical protein